MSDNDVVLVVGESMAGKTYSLIHLEDHSRVAYLSCDGTGNVPFDNNFNVLKVTPNSLHKYLDMLNKKDSIDYIVLDTLTFLLDSYRYDKIEKAKGVDGQAAWGTYSAYIHNIILKLSELKKTVIVLAHTYAKYAGDTLIKESVLVKGGTDTRGIEAMFNYIVAARVLDIEKLEDYKNPLLSITDDERRIGIKYVYQTRKTRDTIVSSVRGCDNFFDIDHSFIDNNIMHVINTLNKKREESK